MKIYYKFGFLILIIAFLFLQAWRCIINHTCGYNALLFPMVLLVAHLIAFFQWQKSIKVVLYVCAYILLIITSIDIIHYFYKK
jgi:hypothetical protein